MNIEELNKIIDLVIKKSRPSNLVCFSFEIKCYGEKHVHENDKCRIVPDLKVMYEVYSELHREVKEFDILDDAISFLHDLDCQEFQENMKTASCNRKVIEIIKR